MRTKLILLAIVVGTCLLAHHAHAQTISLVQDGYSGDNSNCGTSLSCTVSTSTSCSPSNTCHPFSGAIGSGHFLIAQFAFEGTTHYPVAGTPVCNGSGCGTWVHLSSSAFTCSLTTCSSSNCWNDYTIQTGGHMYVSDCWAVYSTTSGSTSITDTITDSAGASDVTNADMFISEWSCSSTCSPSIDAQGAKMILPGTCTSCVGPALTLTGANDVVIPMGIFSELYSSISSPYTLMFNDSVAGNAIGYNENTSSGGATTWGSSSSGGGIFQAIAISVGGPLFSYSPSPVAFGSVAVSGSSPLTVTITNSGSGSTLNIGTLSSGSGLYVISSDGCSSQNIAAAAHCTFVLTFSPTVAGAQNATITVPDNVGNPDTISATGTGSIIASTQVIGTAGITLQELGIK